MIKEPIRVVQYGLGPIGAGIARLVSERPGMMLVGAVDIDPDKVGKYVAQVIGLGETSGVRVSAHLEAALATAPADVAFHATGSSLKMVMPQLEACIRAGLNVVSTCEELAYPAAQYPDLARELDSLASQHGVTVLGTGINPGFAMDVLALFMSGVCQQVERVSIKRTLDASARRLPLQKKIGAGLSVPEFQQLVQAKAVRHVGLIESAAMLADGLGWTVDRFEDMIEPVVADRILRSEYLEVQPGHVAGVHQVARGFIGDREALALDLTMALQAENPGDFVKIEGKPNIEVAIKGIHGDLSTAAVVVNAAPRVIQAKPGLLTMKDIAIPCYWSSSL